jgi:hypothetical protein
VRRPVSKKAVLLWATGGLFLIPGLYFVWLGNQPFHFLERSAGILLLLMSVALVRAATQEARLVRSQHQKKRLQNSKL